MEVIAGLALGCSIGALILLGVHAIRQSIRTEDMNLRIGQALNQIDFISRDLRCKEGASVKPKSKKKITRISAEEED